MGELILGLGLIGFGVVIGYIIWGRKANKGSGKSCSCGSDSDSGGGSSDGDKDLRQF